jgi:hypothetical protein
MNGAYIFQLITSSVELPDLVKFRDGMCLTHKFWKILYFDAVKDKFGSFVIKGDRIRVNSCYLTFNC